MTSSQPEPPDMPPGEPAPGPIAIVAGHGDFAAGLISAVAQITGRGELLMPISNRGLGATDIEAALRAAAGLSPVRVIFTDLPAGSCTIAARRLLRDRSDLRLVTGVNLPAVIDFVMSADVAPPAAADAPTAADASAQAVAHAVERGRGALALVALPAAPPAPPAPPSAPPSLAAAAPGPEVGGAR